MDYNTLDNTSCYIINNDNMVKMKSETAINLAKLGGLIVLILIASLFYLEQNKKINQLKEEINNKQITQEIIQETIIKKEIITEVKLNETKFNELELRIKNLENKVWNELEDEIRELRLLIE